MTESNEVFVTTTEKGILMKYKLSFNDRNIYLKRDVDLQPFNRSTVVCIGRRNLSTIRLDEGPDLRTASLLAVGAGLGVGGASTLVGWGISGGSTGATIGGFGGFLAGFAAGFTFSMNRYRVACLQLKLPAESYTLWTPTDNIQRIQNLLQECNGKA
eukprot:CAMPEP_0202713810 /NCGR_PEP_ID=MMETSP1385-20130828/59774_1 /ASSEMBLY_ACC=CAM_ASM_000861 /TAXON_ID=933848 /ORGANISM="Elphidium margaritaceum" /LENGTH=156 /DNA_ID=CAMNT_0049374309 /DNA_START=78 /DNA_END=548 /DNA_ORIENTATION=+